MNTKMVSKIVYYYHDLYGEFNYEAKYIFTSVKLIHKSAKCQSLYNISYSYAK